MTAALTVLLLAGCGGEGASADASESDSSATQGDREETQGTGLAPSMGVTTLEVTGLGGAPMEQPKPVGDGTPEVCDGLDNDGDGFIDNVDEGKDGICDCLNIGTIGRIGPWSDGGDIFKGWLDARSPIPAQEIGDAAVTRDVLAGLDVVVVLRVDTAASDGDQTPAHHAFSPAEIVALEEWVRAGGGLMTTIGYQQDEALEIVNVNQLLAPFSLGYDANDLELTGFLTDWDPTHPISFGVSNIKTENGVAPLATGLVVASDASGRPGVVASEPDAGRVLVFGDEWITYDSEWQDTEGQQVELLWLNMLKWLSPPEECQVAIPPELVR